MKTRNDAAVACLAILSLAAAVRQAAAAPIHSRRLLATFVEGTQRAEREKVAAEMGLAVKEDLEALEMSVLEPRAGAEFLAAQEHIRPKSVLALEEDVERRWLLEEKPSFPAPSWPDVEDIRRSLSRLKASTLDVGVPWGVARVDAPAAWMRGQGSGVKVAVIDTGVDCAHPDLRCDFASGANILDPGRAPRDDNEHGTHVAGTIAGRGLGGPLGVAPRATVIAVKVLNAEGAGRLSDIIKGIDWAAGAGVHVINMSLGAPRGSAAMARAVKKAMGRGITVVCAAGNEGPGPGTIGFPAAYPGVIAVGASTRPSRLAPETVAPFSSRGDEVSFIAPGVGILSTVPGGGTATLSGTSMASPHVAGLAALSIERGAKGPMEVKRALRAAAKRLCTASSCLAPDEEGAGMIDAAKLR